MKIDIKGWLRKLKTEFKRRVIEFHYRLVEFDKKETNTKWWSIQRLEITGWKEVEIEFDKKTAIIKLNSYLHQFVPPKQKILKEV